jgi:hypothetical protein
MPYSDQRVRSGKNPSTKTNGNNNNKGKKNIIVQLNTQSIKKGGSSDKVIDE